MVTRFRLSYNDCSDHEDIFSKIAPQTLKILKLQGISQEIYRDELVSKFSDENLNSDVLNRYSWSTFPLQDKKLSKAIMTKSRLQNKFLKNGTVENRIFYIHTTFTVLSLLSKKMLKKLWRQLQTGCWREYLSRLCLANYHLFG